MPKKDTHSSGGATFSQMGRANRVRDAINPFVKNDRFLKNLTIDLNKIAHSADMYYPDTLDNIKKFGKDYNQYRKKDENGIVKHNFYDSSAQGKIEDAYRELLTLKGLRKTGKGMSGGSATDTQIGEALYLRDRIIPLTNLSQKRRGLFIYICNAVIHRYDKIDTEGQPNKEKIEQVFKQMRGLLEKHSKGGSLSSTPFYEEYGGLNYYLP